MCVRAVAGTVRRLELQPRWQNVLEGMQSGTTSKQGCFQWTSKSTCHTTPSPSPFLLPVSFLLPTFLIFSFFFHLFFHLGLSIRRVHGASFQHYVWVLARCSSCKKMLRETPPPSHLRVKTQTKSNRELTLVLSTPSSQNTTELN